MSNTNIISQKIGADIEKKKKELSDALAAIAAEKAKLIGEIGDLKVCSSFYIQINHGVLIHFFRRSLYQLFQSTSLSQSLCLFPSFLSHSQSQSFQSLNQSSQSQLSPLSPSQSCQSQSFQSSQKSLSLSSVTENLRSKFLIHTTFYLLSLSK